MFRALLSVCLFTSFASSAYAACSTPTADAGGTFYNTTVNTVQFCNGIDWYNTGPVVPGATGTACTNPVSPEGGMYYNTTQNTVQFCNGDDWVNMGTMKFPAASGTACTTPTGPEGGMFYNTATFTMQFCNGDDWVNATYIMSASAAIAAAELVKVQAPVPVAGDYFGFSVAIDGGYAIVGANRDDTGATDAGAAYIFKRTGASWAQEAVIHADTAQLSAHFGIAVGISGDYVIVGAKYYDSDSTDSGAAYMFKRTGTSWAQEAKILAIDAQASDYFGEFVSISGDYAIIGANKEDTGGSKAGSAYIFKRTGVNWAQEAKIQSADVAASDYFGSSVSISGDYAIVGATGVDGAGLNEGAVYVFKRTGTSWAQEEKLVASDALQYDSFGDKVSLSGEYAIIGAYGEDTGGSSAGAAYMFKRTGTSWAQQTKLFASDQAADDRFGQSVSLSGDFALVGAWGEDTGGLSAGAAYVFRRIGTNWIEESKIQASDKEADDQFGKAVAISNGKIIIGALEEDTGATNAGAAYIFE
jgi:hypothetical protein